jgi:NitT/TauT family transport system ATP-binding protein
VVERLVTDISPSARKEPAARAKLLANDLAVSYSSRARNVSVAIDGLSLTVNAGEFISIVGPSGCGKTSLLRVVLGLVPASRGTLIVNGRRVTGPGTDRAMVFQQSTLLPWRTVLSNVSYGLDLRGVPKAEATARARRYIDLVGLADHHHSYPRELSGGMQQRVNLARALATESELLLFDEPFAALDAQTREYMQREVQDIWSLARTTAIFVTHDIKEAIYLADRVIVLTARPARVRESIVVDFPRPRPLEIKRSQAFLDHEAMIWSLIEEEASKQLIKTRSSTQRDPNSVTTSTGR